MCDCAKKYAARIARLERQLNIKTKESDRLKKSLSRAHRNNEELREKLFGNRISNTKKAINFETTKQQLLSSKW